MEENKKGLLNMPVQSVKLNGSVQTIFQLWGLLLIFAVCGLLGEINFENTIKFVFNLYSRFTQVVLKEVRKFRRKKIAFFRSPEMECSINSCSERATDWKGIYLQFCCSENLSSSFVETNYQFCHRIA